MANERDHEGTYYKVLQQLDEHMPKAARPQKAGVSFDLRLYFREDEKGGPWAEVSFLDRDNNHKIIPESMPLDHPGAVAWFFGEIADRGFPLARQLRTGGNRVA